MAYHKYFDLRISESLRDDTDEARHKRNMDFSEYARTSIHLVATMKHMDVDMNARVITPGGRLLPIPCLDDNGPHGIRKSIYLDEQSIQHAIADIEQGRGMAERIRRSLLIANFVVEHTLSPYNYAPIAFQGNHYTFVW